MSKDPFQELVDELTALRRSIEHIARTSLNKDEAKKLNQIVTAAVLKMAKAAEDAPGEIQGALEADRNQMARSATQAAGEARREAWRWFGGFWVWLVSVGVTGVVIGVLGMAWIQGRGDAREFGQFPRIYCSPAGGEDLSNTAGREGCMFWYD
jgi:hypothetical protein